jgi:3-hydroxyacyl-[acyl-carrier-protein] dehydratase
MSEPVRMDIREIRDYLMHRYPFLLVDRVLECRPGSDIVAIKNVTVNEPFFPGHFPARPVMPGVLIIEALAQAAGILAFLTADRKPDPNGAFYFAGIDKARFRRPVVPGDQLVLEVSLTRHIRGVWKFSGVGRVDGAVAAGAEIMVVPKGDDR